MQVEPMANIQIMKYEGESVLAVQNIRYESLPPTRDKDIYPPSISYSFPWIW